MKTVLVAVGVRSHAPKLWALLQAESREGLWFHYLHSGQHPFWETWGASAEALGLPAPLEQGRVSGEGGERLGEMVAFFAQALRRHRPDWFLAIGDADTALAAALAAHTEGVPLAHVEAGLRTPCPNREDGSRRAITPLARLHLAPSRGAVENLLSEGVERERVVLTGDLLADAHGLSASRWLALSSSLLPQLGLKRWGYIVASLHRKENRENPKALREFCRTAAELAQRMPVLILRHPSSAEGLLEAGCASSGVGFLAADYLETQALLSGAKLVITDSGGLEREAYLHGVPSVVYRPCGEWTELHHPDFPHLAPPGKGALLDLALAYLEAPPPRMPEGILGDGRARERILEALLRV